MMGRMFQRHTGTSLLLGLAALCGSEHANAQNWWTHPYWPSAESIPVSGRPVPELEWLDDHVREFMSIRNSPNMVFGIMLDGRIVYLRGFGHNHDFQPLPENTPFRLASVSKTITAAAARHLISTGAIALGDFVFDRGQPGGGILPSSTYAPVGAPDTRIGQITVSHLIHHRSGWYAGEHTDGQDFVWYDQECAAALGVSSPPGSTNKIRCILANPLAFDPGTEAAYSNINTLILGEVIQHVSGMALEDYVRTFVMRPAIGIPATEIQGGRTFREWQDPREPYYRTSNASYTGPWMFPNAFDNYGPAEVANPYGAYAVEDAVPFGAFVASASAMLEFARRYNVAYSETEGSEFGMPVNGPVASGGHNGSLPGFESVIEQREVPGVGSFRFFVATSYRQENNTLIPNRLLDQVREALISGEQVYPDTTSDGFWTSLDSAAPVGVGGFHAPFQGVQRMLDQTTAGSKVRLFPGSQNWTGVINTPMVIDAPLGPAVIGQ
ncbi:MAG TPA: serine hydrolase domain-containing protein [Xanthomonadaceae bacterium]|nr:serine hydrolase domain-containing protein [Xanthomonadaceae bacterium]